MSENHNREGVSYVKNLGYYSLRTFIYMRHLVLSLQWWDTRD